MARFTQIDKLREHREQAEQLLDAGVSYALVGRMFCVSKYVVREFCKENGISRGANANNEDDVARKIREKSGGLLEYVSGYTVKERPVLVRCTVCGGEFERAFHSITANGGAACPHCASRKRTRKLLAEAKARNHAAMERKKKAEEKKAEAETRAAARVHACPVCGTITTRPKYCSDECCHKANNKTKEIKRRERIQAVLKDADITVLGLFKRDRGVCYLCGGQCDLEDYTVRDGVFIAGDWYPSVDHMVPLIAGGEHSWDNVRLAHRRCNSIKGGRCEDCGEA